MSAEVVHEFIMSQFYATPPDSPLERQHNDEVSSDSTDPPAYRSTSLQRPPSSEGKAYGSGFPENPQVHLNMPKVSEEAEGTLLPVKPSGAFPQLHIAKRIFSHTGMRIAPLPAFRVVKYTMVKEDCMVPDETTDPVRAHMIERDEAYASGLPKHPKVTIQIPKHPKGKRFLGSRLGKSLFRRPDLMPGSFYAEDKPTIRACQLYICFCVLMTCIVLNDVFHTRGFVVNIPIKSGGYIFACIVCSCAALFCIKKKPLIGAGIGTLLMLINIVFLFTV